MNERSQSHHRRLLVLVLAAAGACVPAKLELFDSGTTESGDVGTTADPTTTDPTTVDPATSDPTTAGPVSCDDPLTNCGDDPDRDGLADACDNAPSHNNPGQSDIDLDGIGDLADLCPTLPNADNPLADTDRDGIGNACDLCERSLAFYNKGAAGIPARMLVRSIPEVEDSDHDGVGDACDNCVRTPNCQGYGDGLDPYTLGDAIDHESADCQADADLDMVGDACAGTMLPGAAGPVGFGAADDFDQDGLSNAADVCPRQPVAFQACAGPADCPDSGICTAGVCNHRDTDNDGVGDICDTCPWNANPLQAEDGGAQVDDPDGDFVGSACESNLACAERPDPRAFGFYDGSVGGYCCVQLFDGGAVLDPHGDPVAPPAAVLNAPGVGVLPPGCTQAAQPLGPDDLADSLWTTAFCLLPQWDQDFDGVGDTCDLCPHSFDPAQEMGQPGIGKYCSGEFDPGELDPAMMCLPGT
jgi:hypothetical protein